MIQVNIFTKQKKKKKLTETQKTNFGYQRGKDTDGVDKLGVWD